MNVAYDLFSMIMIVIMCNYLIVWDNHHYITSLLFFGDNTTTYGLHPLSNYGSRLWNSLPNATRSLLTVAAFKLAIRDLEFGTDCCPFCK